MKKYISILFTSLVILTSCSTSKKQAENKNNSKSTTVTMNDKNDADQRLHDLWAITQVGDESIVKEDFPSEMPMFEINLKEESISGTDGCNRFRGSFTATADSLTIGNLMSTQMACPNMKISDMIGRTLGTNTFSYKLVKGKLLLSQDNSVVVVAKHID